MLAICQSDYEALLRRELSESGLTPGEGGAGWVNAAAANALPDGNVFAHNALIEPVEIAEQSVNALARQVATVFLDRLKGRTVDALWPSWWFAAPQAVGLGRRTSAVERTCLDLIALRVPRVARLARVGFYSSRERERAGGSARSRSPLRGLFVFFPDFNRAFVSTEAVFNGQRRMADDLHAPSRSYLKIEEAYGVLGREPKPDETVVDLGAAPGGWSYSAAKRGAKVVAVDNGPLKEGAANNPNITHVRADAFAYRPLAESGELRAKSQPDRLSALSSSLSAVDWLLCDLVEEPHHVIRNIVEPWLSHRWCRNFIVNLKFGRVDPLELIRELRSPASPFVRHAADFRIIHLYHNREELTVCGKLTANAREWTRIG